MQVSLNAEDANVRPRRPDRPRDLAQDPKRQSLRLIDLHQELPAHVEYPRNPSVRFFEEDPFSPSGASFEALPQALLDRAPAPARDPFDLSYLQPPQQQFSCSKAANNGASQSTPSLPIAVAARPSGDAPDRPSELSTSSGITSMSSASMRLSSSADSALAALPPPPPPPGQHPLANSDEVDACGCHDHPDLPPRASLQTADRPRIMPILENGQRTSYTHYWVIPPRTPRSALSESPNAVAAEEEHYVNVRGAPALVTRSASMPPRTQPRERRYVKRPCGEPESDPLGCATNRAFVDDAVELLAGEPEPDAAPVVSSVESDSSWEAHHQQQQLRATPTPEERRARILAVRGAVHGVTDEEAQMILQTHRWDVARSVRLLKVEQLFRLGATPSKSECKRVLDDADGDLALASSRLIDQQGLK